MPSNNSNDKRNINSPNSSQNNQPNKKQKIDEISEIKLMLEKLEKRFDSMELNHSELIQKLNAIPKQLQNEIKSTLDQFKKFSDETTSALKTVESRLASLEGGQPGPPLESLDWFNYRVWANTATFDEIQLRREKLNNMVYVNMPESTPPLTVTDDERSDETKNAELKMIRDQMDKVGGNRGSVTGVFRMGSIKEDINKARPLKILCNCPDSKHLFLTKQKLFISKSNMPHSYVRDDYTPYQRKLQREAKSVLFHLRKDPRSVGRKFIIKNYYGSFRIFEQFQSSPPRLFIDPFNNDNLLDLGYGRPPARIVNQNNSVIQAEEMLD